MTSPHPPSAVTSPPALPGGGAVLIAARWRAGRLIDCRLASRRPDAARLLLGKSAPEVLALVPRLFSLCGQAQRAAAEAALAAADGAAAAPAEDSGGRLRRESIGEHLWRLMIDWPTRLQQAPQQAAFAGWYRRLRSAEPAVELATALASATESALLAPLLDALAPWERPLDLAPRYLPTLDADLAAELFSAPAPSFAATPSFGGGAVEVGAMARFGGQPEVDALVSSGRPLAARLTARWLALRAEIAATATGDAAAPVAVAAPGGLGYAWVETSRGPLCHRVVLEGGRVTDYAVIAPTEWNFHPASAWAAGLAGTPAETPEVAENLLRLWALALDPCVPVQLTLNKES